MLNFLLKNKWYCVLTPIIGYIYFALLGITLELFVDSSLPIFDKIFMPPFILGNIVIIGFGFYNALNQDSNMFKRIGVTINLFYLVLFIGGLLIIFSTE